MTKLNPSEIEFDKKKTRNFNQTNICASIEYNQQFKHKLHIFRTSFSNIKEMIQIPATANIQVRVKNHSFCFTRIA